MTGILTIIKSLSNFHILNLQKRGGRGGVGQKERGLGRNKRRGRGREKSRGRLFIRVYLCDYLGPLLIEIILTQH